MSHPSLVPFALLAPLALVAPLACTPWREPAARVPVVEEPACALLEEEPAPGGVVETVPLAPHAGCTGAATVQEAHTVSARRADGSLDVDELVIERTVVAYPDGAACRLHIDTVAYERKLDDLLELDPVPARVTLCAARVTTSHPLALAEVRAELRRLEVGHEPRGGPAELTTLTATPRLLPVEDAAAPVVCGDEGDVSTHLDGYAFRHRAIVEVDAEDLLRLSWDGALELSLDVLFD